MNKDNIEALIISIEQHIGQSLKDKSRKKDVVLGRYIFARIARDQGITHKVIGQYCGVHYSTIIHYIRNFESYMAYDQHARTIYEELSGAVPKDTGILYQLSVDELRDEVRRLREDNKRLSLTISNLSVQIKRQRDEEERLVDIYELVRRGVPRGSEDTARIKFNHIINGLR